MENLSDDISRVINKYLTESTLKVYVYTTKKIYKHIISVLIDIWNKRMIRHYWIEYKNYVLNKYIQKNECRILTSIKSKLVNVTVLHFTLFIDPESLKTFENSIEWGYSYYEDEYFISCLGDPLIVDNWNKYENYYVYKWMDDFQNFWLQYDNPYLI